MKGHIIFLVVTAVLALAVLVYVEQAGAHSTRLRIATMLDAGAGSLGTGTGPEPDSDITEYSAADYPNDIADTIPTPASGAPEPRRGISTGIVLAGQPTAPMARPAQPRGISVARHAADLTGQQIIPVPAQEDLLA
jgi:hypothetical protein